MECHLSPTLSARSTALLLVAIAVLSSSSSLCQAVCTWNYDKIPPKVPLHEDLFLVPCNPFANGSIYSVNFAVTGPFEVELSCYFESTNKILVNSTKHTLVNKVSHAYDNENNTLVTVDLVINFSNLNESEDSGIYYCNARVKETSNLLSPVVRFNINTPSLAELYNDTCNKWGPRHSEFSGNCPQEIIPPQVTRSQSSSSSSSVTSTGATSSYPSIFISLQPPMTSYTDLSSSHISMFSDSTIMADSTTYTRTLLHSSFYLPVPSSVPIQSTSGSGPVPSTSNSPPANAGGDDVFSANPESTPPVNTWFYLLSVVVVLAFLAIIMALILGIFCYMNRSSNSRRTTVIPSSSSEIGVRRIASRLPSDPLPKIIKENTKGRGSTDDLPGTTTSHSVIRSGPINRTGSSYAMSLQHLAFNLSSFQSSNTIYDEIDAPGLMAEVDIARESHDYVNGNQRYTLMSDATNQSNAIPPNTQDSEDLSCCIEGTPEHLLYNNHQNDTNSESTASESSSHIDDDAMTTTLESDTTTITTTGGDEWYGTSNSPLAIVPQSAGNIPWGDGSTNPDTLDNQELFLPSLSPSVSYHSVSSEGQGFLEYEDDQTSGSATGQQLPITQSTSVEPTNTLSGQTFGLTTPISNTNSGQMGVAIDSRFIGASSTIKSMNLLFPNVANDLTKDDSFGLNNTNDSRSSSATSGCTDISKYSGDYDRDPAYMRLILSRVRPRLPGHTSLEVSNEDLREQEVRADSGMESLYTDPTVVTHPSSMLHTNSSDLYKSLNSLTMDPETLYSVPSLKPWVEPRAHAFHNSI